MFYQGNQLVAIDDVLKKWGYRCPVCLSKVEPKVVNWKIEAKEVPKIYILKYNKYFTCIKKVHRGYEFKCALCGRHVSIGELYYEMEPSRRICFKCFLETLTPDELELVREIVYLKYGINLT